MISHEHYIGVTDDAICKKKKKVSSLPSSNTQTEVLPLANLKFQRVEVVLFSPLQHRV